MTTTELRRQLVDRVRRLPRDRLRVADDFLAYLHDRQDNAATAELLRIPGFRAALHRAERQAASGRTVPWAKVRRDV